MPLPSLVYPIVLAAGASSRMGEPKALLDIRGRTALERIADCCREAGSETPLVVTGFHAERIGPEAERQGCTVAHNPEPERGQISSLKTGLRALPRRADGFFIWPVDVPLVLPDTVRALLRALHTTGAGITIAVPVHNQRRGHPVLLAATVGEELLALDGEQTARDVIRRDPKRVLELGVDDRHVLDRINTRLELERLLATPDKVPPINKRCS